MVCTKIVFQIWVCRNISHTFVGPFLARMQIGIQHTDNRLLKKVNRGHTIEDSIHAIKLLKDSGFKIIAHLMPDLPGAAYF